MRIVTTEKGKTTTLDGHDVARIDRVQLTLRVLARECPLIPAYGKANQALEDVAAMFGQKRKIIESFIVKDVEEQANEQPASGEQQSEPPTVPARSSAGDVATGASPDAGPVDEPAADVSSA